MSAEPRPAQPHTWRSPAGRASRRPAWRGSSPEPGPALDPRSARARPRGPCTAAAPQAVRGWGSPRRQPSSAATPPWREWFLPGRRRHFLVRSPGGAGPRQVAAGGGRRERPPGRAVARRHSPGGRTGRRLSGPGQGRAGEVPYLSRYFSGNQEGRLH